MKLDNDFHLGVCQAIESGLCAEYDANPDLNDALCILGLDNAIIAVKQKFGFARNEGFRSDPPFHGIVAHVVSVGVDNIGEANDMTLKEYVAIVNKVRKSVLLHSSFGPCGYYDFIQNYV